ncbi:hypothetical protein [Pseudomonas sp. URMO17WK12:I2]|uniref:hypothetical protein n=1 Tax=Pseudomonas sp. URMO17WK12:I2 TaxID=1261623 RepID=UPI000DADE077|nr:hypothetical protein [Pseudomonas sp. URMO17WK12:I2]PZW39022.1 hypothetical protein F469_04862 [Pseudomonas sp. URMO17WK12:I2]
MNFKRVGMKLLLALVFISVLTSFLVVFLMKLLAALYIYIVGGGEFSWAQSLIMSARGGVGGGVVLGIGIWVMAKLEELKSKNK